MIGKFTHNIKIQCLTLDENDSGGAKEVWKTVKCVKAEVSPLRSNRSLTDNQVQLSNAYQIHFWYKSLPSMSKSYRIIHDNKPLTIISLIDISLQARYWEITAVYEG